MPSAHLYQKARQWDQKARQWENAINPRDRYGYVDLLDEITFHAELRYGDYVQLQGQGPFSAHLERWLDNLTNEHQQQALLRVFDHLTFIDNDQMLALYRDAFRRIISAWMMPESTIDAMLAVDYNLQRLRALAEYQIATITQSCDAGLLLKANDLGGLRRPVLLGPSPRLAQAAILALGDKTKGLIVCEDIVGTGRQANRVLKAVETHAPTSWRILFVPLIAFEVGVKELKRGLQRTAIEPVVILPAAHCLRAAASPEEPEMFKALREIVKSSSERVLARNDYLDVPPKDPFGYEDSGGLIVPCHNTPNNTLPLIHHKAPQWDPLFRRLHHRESM